MKQYRALIISCILLVIVTVFAVAAYGRSSASNGLNGQKKGAAAATAQKNQEVYTQLDFSDTRGQEFAERGLITAPDSINLSLWRNVYLVGTFELRNGTALYPEGVTTGVGSTAQNMDAETMLDYMGIMMDSNQLSDRSFTVNLQLADDENYLLKIHHGVLLYYPGEQDDKADLTIQTRKLGILAITARNEDSIGKLVTSVEGDQELYKALCGSMVSLKLYFNIAEP